MKISSRFEALPASETMAIAQRVLELRRAGHDVISFAAGEPDFATPPHIVDAMARAARDGATRYPPLLGLPELREAIARTASARYEVALDPSAVAVTPGAKLALWAAFQLLVDPGDDVLVPTPCWVSYAPMIALAGGRMVPVATAPEAGFRLDPDAVRAAITPRTVGIALNLPNNPTGALASHEAMRAIAELALEHDLWLVVDDIYAELRFEPGPYPSPLRARPELCERTIIVDGLSKSHAMTGWRIGWAIVPGPLMKPMATLLGQTVTGVTTFVQHGALAALEGDDKFVAACVSAYRARRAVVCDGFARLGLEATQPEGAFYTLVDVRALLGDAPDTPHDDMALTRRWLDEAQVAVVPGAAFSAPGFVRASFACAEAVITSGLARIGASVQRLANR